LIVLMSLAMLAFAGNLLACLPCCAIHSRNVLLNYNP
jgi:hypothetical protein